MPQDLSLDFAPLPDRIGSVGGIESITLDGRRYYFGFDYRSDLVLSPLIDDPATMAVFAGEYLRQTTGKHDAAYWAELVALSAAESSLTGDDASRTFTSQDLRGGLPEPGSHLLYLLGAATSWEAWFEEAPDAQRACAELGFDDDDTEFFEPCLRAVREHGIQARRPEWAVVSFYLTAAVRHASGNWGILFAPVAEAVTGRRQTESSA
jgi:hypothetical protein